jgi:hypothetical protein
VREWDDPNLIDELKFFRISEELVQWTAWRFMSDLLRRHSNDLFLYMDYYPTGNPMLSVINSVNGHRVSLNMGGSLHFFDNQKISQESISPWLEFVRHGFDKPRRLVEAYLSVPIGKSPDIAHAKTVGPRAIAAFLSLSALSGKRWHVGESFGLPSSDSPEHGSFDQLGDVWPGDHRIGQVPITQGWQLRNHKGDLHAIITANSFAATSSRGPINLLERYRESSGNMARVVAPLMD